MLAHHGHIFLAGIQKGATLFLRLEEAMCVLHPVMTVPALCALHLTWLLDASASWILQPPTPLWLHRYLLENNLLIVESPTARHKAAATIAELQHLMV